MCVQGSLKQFWHFPVFYGEDDVLVYFLLQLQMYLVN